MSADQRWPDQRGYSLIELAVASASFAIVGLLLFSVFVFTSRFAHRSEARVDAFQEARLALQVMASELREASVLPNALVIWSRDEGDANDAVGFLSARMEGSGRPFTTDIDGVPYWQEAVFYLYDSARGELRRLVAEPGALALPPLWEQGRILAREVRRFRVARRQDIITVTLTMGTPSDEIVLEIAVRPRN